LRIQIRIRIRIAIINFGSGTLVKTPFYTVVQMKGPKMVKQQFIILQIVKQFGIKINALFSFVILTGI